MMRVSLRHLGAAAAAMMIAACATTPVSTTPVGTMLVCDPLVSKIPACVERMQALAADAATAAPAWSLAGRAAITHGSQSGSVGVEWEDAGSAGYTVSLRAPITGQTWQLRNAAGQATLTGLAGGPRTGSDAAALLREATRFEIPVRQMRYWARGFADPELPVQRYVFAGNRLASVMQDGWQIDIAARDPQGRPLRVNAARGADKVRLVIDRWNDPAE